jgi:hypothetical protein
VRGGIIHLIGWLCLYAPGNPGRAAEKEKNKFEEAAAAPSFGSSADKSCSDERESFAI